MKNKNWLWLALAVGLIALIVYVITAPVKPGKLDAFASCLAEEDAKFYGTFWCPHCRNQKALFGKSARLLPYIECSTPDGNSQLQICEEANIEGYPTWEFADGTRMSGTLDLETLAEKTSCELPNQE